MHGLHSPRAHLQLSLPQRLRLRHASLEPLFVKTDRQLLCIDRVNFDPELFSVQQLNLAFAVE
jgi:hypothetical protein